MVLNERRGVGCQVFNSNCLPDEGKTSRHIFGKGSSPLDRSSLSFLLIRQEIRFRTKPIRLKRSGAVKQCRIPERQDPNGSTDTDLSANTNHVPQAEQIAFRNIGNCRKSIKRAEPATNTELSRGLLFDSHFNVNFIFLHLFGKKLDRFKKIQIVESLKTSPDCRGIQDLLFIHSQLPANDVITRLIIPRNVNLSHPNKRSFFDRKGNLRCECFRIRGQVWCDFGK